MKEIQAELLIDCKNALGEGIQWSVRDQRVYWLDIENARLYSCNEAGQDLVVKELPERLCAFAFDPDGNILGAFASGFYRYNPVTEQRDLLALFDQDIAGTRLNDGRCDRDGRFICGGFVEGSEKPITSVVSYERGALKPLISSVTCTNSISFSGDGKRMYFADSPTKIIYYYDYDKATGAISNRTVFATLADGEGVPDGSAVDANDGLWNARFFGSCVQQYLPDGTLATNIAVPVPNVTCACFGGKNLDKLFITTARVAMRDDQLDKYPQAGGLFVATPGVKGRPEDGLAERLFS